MSYDYESNPQSLLLPENIRYHLHLKHIFKIIDKLKKGKLPLKILEIGCGGGINLYAIKQRYGDSVAVYGLDISHTAISVAQDLSIGEFKQGASDEFSYSEKFDLIMISDVLEHLPTLGHVEKTLDSVRSHLDSAGYFYLCCPIELNPQSLHWWFKNMGIFANNTRKYYGHLIQFRHDQLINLLKKNFAIDELAYSCHFFGQLQTFLFFVLPKELLSLFSSDVERSLRDSNLLDGRSVDTKKSISVLRKLYEITVAPFKFISYYESQLRKYDKFAANTIHVFMCKADSN